MTVTTFHWPLIVSVEARRKFHRILKRFLQGSTEIIKKKSKNFEFLEIQWLRLCVSTVGDAGSVSGQGTKIPHAQWQKKKRKKKHWTEIHLYLPFYRSHGIQNHHHPFSYNEEWTLGKRQTLKTRFSQLTKTSETGHLCRNPTYIQAPSTLLLLVSQLRLPESINYRHFYPSIHRINIYSVFSLCRGPRDKPEICTILPWTSSRFRKLTRVSSFISNVLKWTSRPGSHSDGDWGGGAERSGLESECRGTFATLPLQTRHIHL